MSTHEKLGNTVLYLLRGCGGTRPGVTSLLKLLYFADYEHYRRHLSTITGETYVALERGPVLDNYKTLFQEFVQDGILSAHEVAIQGQTSKKLEYRSNCEPDDGIFSESERETLNEVIQDYGHETGRNLSDITHLEGPWGFVWSPSDPGRTIPPIAFRWLDNLPNEADLQAARTALIPHESQIQSLN